MRAVAAAPEANRSTTATLHGLTNGTLGSPGVMSGSVGLGFSGPNN